MPTALSAARNSPAYHSWSILEPHFGTEDELVRALERRPLRVRHDSLDENGGERNRALPVLGLRLPNSQDRLDEVDVPPAQRKQLEAPHARQHESQEHHAGLLVRKRPQDATDLDRLEDPPLPPPHLRPLSTRHRVRLYELLAHRGHVGRCAERSAVPARSSARTARAPRSCTRQRRADGSTRAASTRTRPPDARPPSGTSTPCRASSRDAARPPHATSARTPRTSAASDAGSPSARRGRAAHAVPPPPSCA